MRVPSVQGRDHAWRWQLRLRIERGFALVLAATDGPTAQAVAERVRGAVKHGHIAIEPASADLRLTLSAGVVEAAPGQTVAELVQAVDDRLYEAKGEHNRVAGVALSRSS